MNKKSIWEDRISHREKSGASVRQFCIDNNISSSTYYYWKRIVRGKSLNAKRQLKKESDFIPVKIPTSTKVFSGKVLHENSEKIFNNSL